MVLNSLYVTFQGEVNPFGMGAPAIFLRLGGCPLRCYKKTMGILCDTPEALSRNNQPHTPIYEIVAQVESMGKETGVKLITLTGGDPLWNDRQELRALFSQLAYLGFTICVETSGTIDWTPYIQQQVYWILDYKLASTGVKNAGVGLRNKTYTDTLTDKDYIKLVVYDYQDLTEAKEVISLLKDNECKAKIAIGPFWGGKISVFDIFNWLKDEELLGQVVMNMQTHKMAVSSNFTTKIPTNI